jgi:PAS domain S-box-containing protein
MADPEMCIPYMRERAESVANLFVASTPNAIVVIDEDEVIRDLNAAAERMFKRKKGEVVGKNLSAILEPGYFRQALQEKTIVQGEVCYPDKELVTYQTIFYEPSERLAMGIIADITEERKRERRLLEIREQTLDKAQGVINKQMEVAQKIAGLLGETTAETKVLLTNLMNTFRNEGENNGTSSR